MAATRKPSAPSPSPSPTALERALDPQKQLCFEDCATGLAGHRPVKLPLGSLAGVEEAFREMLFLQSTEKKLSAESEKRIASEKATTKARLTLKMPVGEQRSEDRSQRSEARSLTSDLSPPTSVDMTFADRIAQLEAAIEEFVTPHKDELVEEGTKQRTLTWGSFGWRKKQDALQPLEGIPADGNPSLLEQLREVLRAALQALELFACGTLRFFKVDVSIDKRAVLSAVKKQELTGRELRRFGYAVAAGKEEFWCETIEASAESQRSEVGGQKSDL